MESEKNTRLISLVALVAAVASLAVGFSAYTRDLVIKPSADVTIDSDEFKVVFSKESNKVDTSNITANENDDGSSSEEATINNNGLKPTISNLSAHFTKPGQKVTYEFYVINSGAIDAYLRNITFNNIATEEVKKKCKAAETENAAKDTEKINSACSGIKLTVTVDNEITATDNFTVQTEKKIDKYTGSNYSSHPIKVEIEYEENATIPDGDITVEFGDIQLTYNPTKPA